MGCSQSQLREARAGANGPNASKKRPAPLGLHEQSSTELMLEQAAVRALGNQHGGLAAAAPKAHETTSLEQLSSHGSLGDKYQLESRVLGTGQFATVKACTDRASGRACAAKLIKISNTSIDRLAIEIDILRKIKGHPNIVGLYDVYVTPTEVQLVMECVVGGELFDHLVESGPYSEAAAVYHMRRIVSAVEFLHRNGIVHRDLKPENLLLTSSDPRFAEVKVADFGLARVWSESTMQTVCGTWAYCAPEVRNDPYGYDAKVDVWSLGVILFVLLAAYHPFDPQGTATEEELWRNAETGRFNFQDRAWSGVSHEALDMIRRMIVVNPRHRFSAEEVLGHPWLTGQNHAVVPLSPRINRELHAVRAKYARQRVAAAGKAAWAAVAFSAAGAKATKRPSSPFSAGDSDALMEEETKDPSSGSPSPPVAPKVSPVHSGHVQIESM